MMELCLDRAPALRSEDALPLLWHWLYFIEPVRTADLAADGHEILGRFLPPVRYPRRMWAGGDVTFENPLMIGRPTEKTSSIEDVAFKEGRTGPLCFVTVRHRISQDGQRAIDEIQTIVYREQSGASEPTLEPETADDAGTAGTTAIGRLQLFRYSALTFNAHRIHYDEPFATRTEGYPGLIVHGPLLATLLAEYGAGLAPTRRVRRFRYRAVGPVFENERFRFEHQTGSTETELAVVKAQGKPAMQATLEWSI